MIENVAAFGFVGVQFVAVAEPVGFALRRQAAGKVLVLRAGQGKPCLIIAGGGLEISLVDSESKLASFCTGVSIMRSLLSVCLLLSLGACSLFEPSGQHYVVFFRGSSAQMDASGEEVLFGAADWAKKHPDMPVIVASYADPYGNQQATAAFTRLRAQVVVDGLVANGVLASRIARREIGSVNFQIDAQESRRVEITVGRP